MRPDPVCAKPCRHCPFRRKVAASFEARRQDNGFWRSVDTVNRLIWLTVERGHACHMAPERRPRCAGGAWFLGDHPPEAKQERDATVFADQDEMERFYER